ncbi:MAG: CYTH and CHAD domain-containing protein [Chloroflexi bacterium]|nr:CYTH and CHAD domain-containing protein [Chloroflexota bacterium]MCY3939255.1 CYTH and CHAD domain-containing protein [Chloroflexota bacterium]
MREREVKLEVGSFAYSPRYSILDDTVVTALPRREIVTEYWDTDDYRLVRWGCTLRFRPGDGWKVKIPKDRKLVGLERDEIRIAGESDSPPADALDLIRAFARGSPVKRVARLRTLREGLRFADSRGGVVAELDYDTVEARQNGSVTASFGEIEVELGPEAPDSILETAVRRLQADGAGDIVKVPKLARALGSQLNVSSFPAAPRTRKKAAARSVIKDSIGAAVQRFVMNLPGLYLDEDIEAVHQVRVAARRLRSNLRTFQPLLDPGWRRHLRSELRAFATRLGPIRDADVLRERLRRDAALIPELDGDSLKGILADLERERGQARGKMIEALRDERTNRLLDLLDGAARNPKTLPEADRPARKLLPKLAAKPWRRLHRATVAAGRNPPDEVLHDIRLKAKQTRYAADAVEPAVGRPAAEFAKAVSRVQETLGDHRDALGAAEWLKSRSAAHDHEVAFAAGQLAGLQLAAAATLRSEWRSAWKRASSPKLRRWM